MTAVCLSSNVGKKKVVVAAARLCSALENLWKTMSPQQSGKLFNQRRPTVQKVRPNTAAGCFNTGSTDKVKMEKRPAVSLYLNELLVSLYLNELLD